MYVVGGNEMGREGVMGKEGTFVLIPWTWTGRGNWVRETKVLRPKCVSRLRSRVTLVRGRRWRQVMLRGAPCRYDLWTQVKLKHAAGWDRQASESALRPKAGRHRAIASLYGLHT